MLLMLMIVLCTFKKTRRVARNDTGFYYLCGVKLKQITTSNSLVR